MTQKARGFDMTGHYLPPGGTAGQRPTAPTGGGFAPTRGRPLPSLHQHSHAL